jgi:hypothetical protein
MSQEVTIMIWTNEICEDAPACGCGCTDPIDTSPPEGETDFECGPVEGDEDECPEDEDCDDPMDGDHESALASAGLGTDEDYGGAEDQFLDSMMEDRMSGGDCDLDEGPFTD